MALSILVTGGAGFIGSNLTHRLINDGHSVTVLDNLLRGNKLIKETQDQVNFVKGDVCDYSTVLKCCENVDVVFHLAAVLGVDVVADVPVETMDVEVIGLRNVVNACLEKGVKKVLYASTSGIYGQSAMDSSITEDILVNPKTSYAIAKRYNEIYLSAAYEEKGLDSVSLRFFNVYGENQDNRMVVPRFFEQAVANEPITVFGNGKQTRDFTYIDDTVEACIQLMEKGSKAEIYNIANEVEGCIEELAIMIKKVTGSSSEIKYIDAPKKRYDYEVERRVGDSSKLFEATGFKPTMDMEKGLMMIYQAKFSK